jgi:small-conductance mechanosensitive channel
MSFLRIYCSVALYFTILLAAAQPAPEVEQPVGAPVLLNQDTIFLVHYPLGAFSKEERAAATTKKINELKENRLFIADSVRVVDTNFSTNIIYGNKVLLSVTDADATIKGSTRQEVAEAYATLIRDSILRVTEQNSVRNILIEIGLVLLVLIAFFFLIKFVNKLFRIIFLKVQLQRDKSLKGLRLKNYELLTPDREVSLVLGLMKAIRVIVMFLLVYILLPILFSIFPRTEGYADTLFSYVLNPLRKIAWGIINYIPNLLTILVIVVVTHYVVKFMQFLANEIEQGKLEISGFYPDWAKPTYNIVRFLLYAFMFVVIFPYLPGSDSPIFQGVSIFIGILFSLGSSSAIANMIAGLVLTYMRSFRIGDRIKIGEVTGDVLEKTLLVTRIRTIKNEDITVPNAMILNNHTVNYTNCCDAKQQGLILHTTVTIGYDVPWPKVQQALIDAALASSFVLKNPTPFVLQTSLDDFYVSYQLNAYTRDVSGMARAYSSIHQNIQDKFNERGIEILSPHYRAQRDGNMTTIPAEYLSQDYEAPMFRVEQNQPAHRPDELQPIITP